MEKLLLLLLFCHVSSAVHHSLKFFYTASSGNPNLPELIIAATVDETPVGYCDTNKKIVEPKQDWMKKLFEQNFLLLEQCSKQCFHYEPIFFKAMIGHSMKLFNQSGGVHTLQELISCEWDSETGKVDGVMQFSYDGIDFLSFDQKTSSWITSKPAITATWDAEKTKRIKMAITHECPAWLRMLVGFRDKFLQRIELPSVSLLQKTSSSPVICHASGFYPDRAALFWRKDGEEIHEGVEHGEILPNHDGTFQMNVDLNISSVTPGDWRRYECVFQLSGVKDDIVTKLDKDVIRTNGEKPSHAIIPITAAMVVLVLVLILITAIAITYKKKQAPEDGSELSERLDPDT